jgi:uncharacterized protein (DUF1697 family)
VPTYIALLRAVNLGGDTAVRMDALRSATEQLGLRKVRTLLQSGNLVFETEAVPPSRLEERLESRSADVLGLRTDYFVRTAEEWSAIVRSNPFPREAKADPAHLVVTVLKAAPPPHAWKALEASIVGRETVRPGDRVAYIVYPDGIGRSRLTARRIEDRLGTSGTSRNWNTVSKLATLASSG